MAARVAELRALLDGRVVWNISSSAVGGGVAEMVRSLLAYARGAGVDARWAVFQGPPAFFALTKRLHNAIHGSRRRRLATRRRRARAVRARRPRQRQRALADGASGRHRHRARSAAGGAWCRRWRAPARTSSGAVTSATTRSTTRSSAPGASSRPICRRPRRTSSRAPRYAPPQLDAARVCVIPPSIDPFSTKNQPLAASAIVAILAHTGIIAGARERAAGVPARGRHARPRRSLRRGLASRRTADAGRRRSWCRCRAGIG